MYVRIEDRPMDEDVNKKKIYTYPDPVLKKHAEPVENINGEIQALIDSMIEIMYSAPGIGLAANQVGQLKRVIVFDLHPEEEGKNPAVLINPEILMSEGEITGDESCLSVIDFSAPVTRKAKLMVRGVDRHGKPMDIEGEDLLSTLVWKVKRI